MQEVLLGFMGRWGYWAVGLLIALENLFPPIPSEVILTFGGFLTTTTGMTVFGTAFFATLGALGGALALYALGRQLGKQSGKQLGGLERDKVLGIQTADLKRAQGWFARHGGRAVFLCRMVPILRSLISIPAGMAAMALGPFLALTAAGSFIWNFALCALGAFLGAAWQDALGALDAYAYFVAALLLVLLGVAWFALKKKRSARER